nr:adenine phosphoribosyltransferase 5-like [Ipomoea trifida]
MFQDITTLLLNPKVFKDTVEIFVDRYKDMGISVVAGVEARGFMFGPPIALAIGAKFVPLRKPGKLPGEVISEAYELEYGRDCLEMHVGAVEKGDRVVVIDDLIATGGTLSAAINLLERMGAEVVECGCVIGLPEVEGQNRLKGRPVYMLVEPRELDDSDLFEISSFCKRSSVEERLRHELGPVPPYPHPCTTTHRDTVNAGKSKHHNELMTNL